MKKKLLILGLGLLSIFGLSGCNHKHDHIEVWNKTDWVFDDIKIDVKDGYFYENHEKFTVDEETIAVTIYFKTDEKDEWTKKEN